MKKIIVLICLLSLTACLPNQTQVDNNQNQPPEADPVANLNLVPVTGPRVSQTATLQAVDDYTGDGLASRSFSQELFLHALVANIPEPAEDKFYEGWLVKSTFSSEFFSTGKLEKSELGYELKYTDDQDHPGFDQVVVTQETLANGLDNKPEVHVLEGNFK